MTIIIYLILRFKNILKKFKIFYFFYFKLIIFDVFRSFWYTNIKKKLKNKKYIYYFNIISSKKHFEK
jgi:hypothetical protein